MDDNNNRSFSKDEQNLEPLSQETTQQSVLEELQKKADLTETQPVSLSEPVEVSGDVSIVVNPDNPITVITDASEKSEDGLTAVQLIEKAMDKSNLMPIQVQLPRDLKQAPDGGLMIADMGGPYIWNPSTASQPLIIDCTGYQSVLVSKTTTGVVTPTVSNDGITYSATLAIASATSVPAATILTAAGNYVLPVVSRYLKLVGPASAVNCTIYLSQSPCMPLLNTAVNMAQFGGTNVVNGGVAGLQGVGGNIAPGTTPTANPIPIGVADDSRTPLTRRLISDRLGKLLVATHGERISTVNETGFTPEYKNVLDVHDTDKSEGNSVLDLLTAILVELKISNQYLYELPRLIDSGGSNLNEPCEYRNDKEAQQCL